MEFKVTVENKIDGRKNLMIDPVVQKKVIWNFMWLGIILMLVNIGTSYFFLNQLILQIEAVKDQNAAVYTLLQDTWQVLLIGSITLTVMILIVVYTYGILISNQIAGPIYKLKKTIQRVLAGEKDAKVVFRKGDYFAELADEMNKLIEKYYSK